MANRYMRQFLFSATKDLVSLEGAINLVAEVKATLVTQGITLTAAAFGTSGNSITFTITGGATAGAEVVTVVGNAISIQIEDGVSTITQCVAALQASAPSQALALATGSGATAVNVATVLPLAGGINGVSSIASGSQWIQSATQSGVGEFTIVMTDAYNALMSIQARLLAATSVDLIPQIRSINVASSSKTIVIRLLTGATPTDPGAACTLYLDLFLRNSSIAY